MLFRSRKGGECEGKGDGSPLAPPSVACALGSNKDNGSKATTTYRRAAPGEFQACVEQLRRAHPDLTEDDLKIRALDLLDAKIRQ